MISVFGGFFIGALQGFGGVDHGLCLLPLMTGNTRSNLLPGLVWGMCHSLGVILICSFLFVLQFYGLKMLHFAAEYMFGATLILSGSLSLYRSHFDTSCCTHSHCEHKALVPKSTLPLIIIGWTGFSHGFSGCGCLVGVLPAFGLSSWSLLGAYAASFLLGSITGAFLFTYLLSCAFSSASLAVREKLILASNVVAILAGISLISLI